LFTLKLAKKKKSFLGVSVLVEPGNGLTALNLEFSMIFQYYPFYEVRKEKLCFFPLFESNFFYWPFSFIL